jgi:hypothetical protein
MCIYVAMDSIDVSRHILLLGGYGISTQIKYRKAATRFSVWCDSLAVVPRSIRQLDYHLSNYMVDLWLEGRSKSEASCTLYGLDMYLPGIRSKMVMSLRSLRGYTKLQPSVSWPPLPWTAATAMAIWLAANHRHHGLAMAVAVILSFDCYLRTGELLGLLYEDVAVGRDDRLGMDDEERIHIHLRRTKTGAHKGVEVRDRQVKVLLLVLLKQSKPGQKLFPWHRSTHLRWFHRCCAALQLSSDYVHHSLRHGGATRDYLNGMSIDDVMVRGRWAATKSAVHYIQQGRQLMMLQAIPPLVDQLGRLGGRSLVASILIALSQHTKVSVGTSLTSLLHM